MQSKEKLKNYRLRQKTITNSKYKHIDQKNIDVTLIMGIVMHKCYIKFNDGNRFTLTIHKIGDVLVLAQPRLDLYTQEKMAVLQHLSDLIYFNDNYLIVEQEDFYTYDLPSRVGNAIFQEQTTVLSLSPELMHEKDYEGYSVNIISKQAKVYKFPTDEHQR